MVRRLPTIEIDAVKSGSALQLFVPGVYAKSSPPLYGQRGSVAMPATIGLGTPVVDAEATAPFRRTASVTAASASTTPSREA
jgi:hypothetical protein